MSDADEELRFRMHCEAIARLRQRAMNDPANRDFWEAAAGDAVNGYTRHGSVPPAEEE
ncbi:hypothetical protein ABT332_06405 [Saccharomonospora azurea]|uniref:hypothetical protein n=1 Tax=Saccharomonospora azurea TaxID=40988 RepID=UPI003326782F